MAKKKNGKGWNVPMTLTAVLKKKKLFHIQISVLIQKVITYNKVNFILLFQ